MSAPGIDGAGDDVREHLARLGVFARRALRFWGSAVALLVGGAVVCAAVLTLRKPTYRSETVILYSEGIRLTDDDERPSTIRAVTLRLKETLMSRSALDAVAREFDLYPEVRRKLGPIDVVEELRRHIEFRAPGGDTFNIAFTGSSPEEAARVTHRLAALVIGQDAELRRKQALVARDFLLAETRTAEADLRRREEELASFMALHPRFAFDPVPFSTGAAIRASLGAATPPPAAAPARGARGASSILRGAPAPAASPPASGAVAGEASAEVARASAAVAAAQANLRDLTTRFTAAHPDVRAAQAEVERETLRLAAARTASRATALHGATPRLPSLDTVTPPPRAARARPPAARSPAAPAVPVTASSGTDVVAMETAWVKLTRSVTEARQQQDQIEAALFKANLAANSESGRNGGQFEILDPAFVPRTPTPPGRTTIVGIFVAASLLLGAFTAIVRALLDDRVHDARDLIGLPELLAEVPRGPSRREHVDR